MEQIEELDQRSPDEESEEECRIDVSWYESNNRSFDVLAQARMCRESFKGWEAEEGSERRWSDPIAEIQTCCSKKPNFHNPNLPVMEILFRIFLETGNNPMNIARLQARVTDWVGERDGRVLSREVIKRLIEGDEFYGIRPVEQASAV